jgi:hypothetical protein
MKCKSCISVIRKLDHRSPVGWKPFAWGPSIEEPNHFYIFPEDTPDNEVQELDVTKICDRNDWTKRE